MKNKSKKVLVLIGILIILLIIFICIVNSMPEEELIITEEQEIEIATQKIENQEVNLLADKNEEERMRYYVSKFMKSLETKDYEKAYELLNSDFKQNYFKTFEEFEKYAKSKFPSTISVNYDNFEKAGEVYIFWVTLTNPLTATKDSGKEMNIVIKEHDLNKYEMSFSVEV